MTYSKSLSRVTVERNQLMSRKQTNIISGFFLAVIICWLCHGALGHKDLSVLLDSGASEDFVGDKNSSEQCTRMQKWLNNFVKPQCTRSLSGDFVKTKNLLETLSSTQANTRFSEPTMTQVTHSMDTDFVSPKTCPSTAVKFRGKNLQNMNTDHDFPFGLHLRSLIHGVQQVTTPNDACATYASARPRSGTANSWSAQFPDATSVETAPYALMIQESYKSAPIVWSPSENITNSALHALRLTLNGDDASYTISKHKTLPVWRAHFVSIDSTQLWADRNIGKLLNMGFFDIVSNDLTGAAGTADTEVALAITASLQTAGVGTFEAHSKSRRKWISFDDAVCVTYVVPWSTEQTHLFINLAQTSTVAVYRTLLQFGVESEIKWINDIYVSGKKISGVLCSSPGLFYHPKPRSESKTYVEDSTVSSSVLADSRNSQRTVVFVGIGLNIKESNLNTEALNTPATSLIRELACGKKKTVLHTSHSTTWQVVPSLSSKSGISIDDKFSKESLMDRSYSVTGKHPVSSQEVVELVFDELSNNFFHVISHLKSYGFDGELVRTVEKNLLWKGDVVQVDNGGSIIVGVLDGIQNDGTARIRTGNGLEIISTGSIQKDWNSS